jgi:hypothetical protein
MYDVGPFHGLPKDILVQVSAVGEPELVRMRGTETASGGTPWVEGWVRCTVDDSSLELDSWDARYSLRDILGSSGAPSSSDKKSS